MKLFYFSIILFFSIFSNAQNPTFDWAKSIGGPNDDRGTSIAVDNSGNVYTSGYFTGIADFDPGVGIFNLSCSYNQVYLSKLDASGGFLWARKLYPSSNMGSTPTSSIKVDVSGNVYVTYQDSITKLSSSGNIVWAKCIGHNVVGFYPNFTIDAIGNLLICGQFSGLVDFNSGSGIDTIRANGVSASDAFILKLDNNGDFVWVKSVGSVNTFSFSIGSTYCLAKSIAVGPSGNVFVAGKFEDVVDFNPSLATYTLGDVMSSDQSLFLLNLDALGNFVWAKNSVGGNVYDVHSISIDNNNTTYITGSFESTVHFGGVVPYGTLSAGTAMEAFLVKYDANGVNAGVQRMGGNGVDWGISVNIDAANNIYVMGQFQGTGYFNSGGGSSLTATGGNSDHDVFISKYDNNGNFIWATSFGSTYQDRGSEMVNDETGNIYITGYYAGICDFDPGIGTYTIAPQAVSTDAFVLKLGNSVIGIEELMKNNSLIIYPNPTNGVVTIKTSSEGSYQLINALGQTIKSFQLNTDNNFTVTIDELPQGIYTLVGKENNQTVSQKIIVIK